MPRKNEGDERWMEEGVARRDKTIENRNFRS
jgi:hypothetical protein